MTTKPKSKAVVPVPQIMPTPISIDWGGPVKERKVVRSKAEPSVFTLEDGTKLVISPVVVGVRRALGQYNQHGQPLYFVTIANYITTDAPKGLLKAAPKAKMYKRTKKIKK